MARSAGISGLAVGLATAGGLLVYTAIRNTSLVAGLRDIAGGRKPGTTSAPTGPALTSVKTNIDRIEDAQPVGTWSTAGGSTSTAGSTNAAEYSSSSTIGEKAADIAKAQIGKPYEWAAAGPNSFDCSGLVSFCLQRAGLKINRMVTGQFIVWSGAKTIPKSQVAKGDLVCWIGHIGIAINSTQMVHAPQPGENVKIGAWWGDPVFRRVVSAA